MQQQSRLHILMILDGIFPIDVRVEKEALSLIKAGHEVTVACPSFFGQPLFEEYKGIHIIRRIPPFWYKKFKAAALTLPVFGWFWRRFVSDILQTKPFDAVHAHDLIQASTALYIQKKWRIPFVVDFHENYPFMLEEEPYSKGILGKLLIPIPCWKRHERAVMKKTAYFLAVAEDMKSRMLALNPSATGFVVENTLNPEEWPTPDLEAGRPSDAAEFKLVYVGGISPMRGLEIAIQGVKLANEESTTSFTLDIFGGGKEEYMKSLQELINRLGLEQRVILKGGIPLPQQGKQLGGYDAGIIPHLKSVQTDFSSPNKLYQYMFYGLPVLSSNCLSLSRVIEACQSGMVYTHNDPSDFAAKLKVLPMFMANHPNLAVSVHRAVVEKYNWHTSEQALLDAYETIGSRKKPNYIGHV